MKLSLSNLAKISSAEINLPGVTVVAGPNGTGKSTISRALMILKTLNRNLPMLVAYERVVSIIAALRSVSTEMQAQLIRIKLPDYDDLGAWGKFLSREFWLDENAVREWVEKHFLSSRDSEDVLAFLTFNSLPSPSVQGNVLARYCSAALAILDKDEIAYARHVCKKVLNTAFSENWLPFGDQEAAGLLQLKDGSGCSLVAFEDGEIGSYQMVGYRESESWLYLEPCHILDFVNKSAFSAVADRYVADGASTLRLLMRKAPASLSRTLEQEESFKSVRKILDRISVILAGRIYDNKAGEVAFMEGPAEDKFEVPLLSMASGMKTLSALYRAIENGSLKKDGLLIIDEPESNLHPEWQIAFARVLVAVRVELNVTILVTTHSPYFMRALEVFMEDEHRKMEFEAYLMRPDQEAARRMMKAECVTDSVEEIYREMYLPLEKIKKSNNSRG